MNKASLAALFDQTGDDYLDFTKVENPASRRADMCAFMLLDKLLPDGGDLIAASEHDEVWLSIDCEELAKVATLDVVRTLARCGVRYDASTDSLCLFT